MFNKKQIIRNYVYAAFCALILLISFTLVYYITFYEEKLLADKIEKFEETPQECNKDQPSYFIYSLCFKLMAAFFAGGILSDGLYIRMGII
jgi:hypothetical protein